MANNKAPKKASNLIIETLKTKSSHKQDVYASTQEWFKCMKSVLKGCEADLGAAVESFDDRLLVDYKDKGLMEAQLSVAGDVLVFHMHTNVFRFEAEHSLWRSSYLSEDERRGYCGIINVYNFLSDSFKFNRMNDVGYLIARIFINSEGHYMVQGKRQLGFLYNDFINAQMSEDAMKSIIESTLLYTLDFDLFTPPYASVQEATVFQMKELNDNISLKTGKRLGFQFSADSDDFEG